ncbi:MAG: Bax inhibitor-1/YccA family protein [Candidatus Gracilibacteria bacterium]
MDNFEGLATRSQTSDFYNKVMSWFGLAILTSGLGVYAGFHYLLPLFVQNPILMYGLFFLEIGLILTSRSWSKKEPLNYFLFSLFAFSSGVTVVPLLASFAREFGGYDIIYRSLFSTTATFLAMGLIGHTSHRSFAGLSGFLFFALIGILITGILGIFIPWGNTMEMIYSGAGVLIFAGYTMVDIQRLKTYPENESMHAAMALYLDIFNLFIFILRLTGAVRRG